MSKEDNKISLTGSNEIGNISIVIDESSKKINILRENVNSIFRETFHLDSIETGDKDSEWKITSNDDSLFLTNGSDNALKISGDGSLETLKKVDNKLKTLESKVNLLESKFDKPI